MLAVHRIYAERLETFISALLAAFTLAVLLQGAQAEGVRDALDSSATVSGFSPAPVVPAPAVQAQLNNDRAANSNTSAQVIRLGFITSLSGVGSEYSKDMVRGIELYLDEIKHKISGKKVLLFVRDDESDPAMAALRAQELTRKEHCQILDGLLLSNVGYAVAQWTDKNQVPFVIAVSGADDITQRQHHPWVVRVGPNCSLPSQAFGSYVYNQLGYRKVVCLGMDYSFGWESVGGFQKSFEEAGGQVVQKIWVPLGFRDFRSFIAKIDPKRADAVFLLTSGQPAFLIPKQYKDSGLKLPIVAGVSTFDEVALRHLENENYGAISVVPYTRMINTPENKRFVTAYKLKYLQYPSAYAADAYISGMVIARAMESLHGDISNKQKLVAALRRVALSKTPAGQFRLDDRANPIQKCYVVKLKNVHGELQNDVIHTLPETSQYWHWTPREYLKQPLYSKDYPPCRYCLKS